MKKLLCRILLVVVVILMAAAIATVHVDQRLSMEPVATAHASDGRFIVVEDCEWDYDYILVYDRFTKVMYSISRGSYNKGIFTLLVDHFGNPLLYKGE